MVQLASGGCHGCAERVGWGGLARARNLAASTDRGFAAAVGQTVGCGRCRLGRDHRCPHADEPQGRAGFGSGNPEVDGWLREDAVVTAASDRTRVVGCYLLNALQVEARSTAGRVVAPSTATAADVEQPVLPALLLSRVAVDVGWQGAGLATALVLHALRAVVEASTPLGVRLLVASDHHDTGGGFCRRFGFTPLRGQPGWFLLPIRDIEATLRPWSR
jgi:predicted N-acetyltransferase YhbS